MAWYDRFRRGRQGATAGSGRPGAYPAGAGRPGAYPTGAGRPGYGDDSAYGPTELRGRDPEAARAGIPGAGIRAVPQPGIRGLGSAYAPQPGMAEMNEARGEQGAILPGIAERPVRTAEEDEAFRKGQRMGVESFLAEEGAVFSGGQRQDGPGMTRERISKAVTTLLKYKAGKASVDNRIIKAQEWWKLRNWEMIQEERGTQGATVQKSATGWLWNSIVGKHADAIDSFPEPLILPRMQDDKDEAKVLSEIVPIVMQNNGFEQTYNDCSWQKMQEGTGGYGVFWDKAKLNGLGDISIRKINLLNLFWEPGINDIQDSTNIFYVTEADNDMLEQMYPQTRGRLKSNRLLALEYRTDDYVSKDDKSADVDWYYFPYFSGRKTLQYCKFVDDIILYSSEDDPETSAEGWYTDGKYPFVLDPLFPVEGSPAGYGYIDIAKDAQADVDTLNQAMILNAVVNATPRHFVQKDGGMNEAEFMDVSKPLVHVRNLTENTARKIDSVTMGAEAFNMLEQKIDEIKFITGNNDINNGGVPSGVTAASAIAALKEDSGRSSKDSTKAAYRAYSLIVTMVIERIRQFYDLPRQFRLIGENGEEEFRYFSNQGLKPQTVMGGMGLEEGMRLPVFDVEVRAQRENAYTRMSQNELALDLMNRGFFNPQMADMAIMALEMMDFKGKETLLSKIRKNANLLTTLSKVGQIALELAQQYRPEIAEKLGMALQGAMAGAGGGMLPSGGENPVSGIEAMKSAEADREQDPNENRIVKRARERTANASRPD